MNLVSVIILNWNGGAENCIESVQSALSQDYKNLEIIFVDNASSDGSLEATTAEFPNLKFIQTGFNLGCPEGRNIGAASATGDILFFLENDGVWNSTDVISQGVKLLNENSDFGAVYTKVEGYNTGSPDPTIDGYPNSNEDTGVYLSSSFRGGASFIRRELFTALGGFPSDYFRQGEERFLSLLIYQSGYKVVYWPKKTMRHKGSDYSGKSDTVFRFNFENEMKTILSLYPISLVILVGLPKFFFYFFKFIARGDALSFLRIAYRLTCNLSFFVKHKRVDIKVIELTDNLRYGVLHININDQNFLLDDLFQKTKSAQYIYRPFLSFLKSK